jgi:hypothetical protein
MLRGGMPETIMSIYCINQIQFIYIYIYIYIYMQIVLVHKYSEIIWLMNYILRGYKPNTILDCGYAMHVFNSRINFLVASHAEKTLHKSC